MEQSQLLSAGQTAVLLGISEWTVKEMARRDMLPHRYLRANRRALRFDAEQLSAFFTDREARHANV